MKRGPVPLLVTGMVIIAAVVMGVSLVFAAQLAGQKDDLQAARDEVQNLRQRLVAVETERDGLRDRVAALEAALIAAGVDPQTIPAEPSAQSSAEAGQQPNGTATPQAPAGRATPTPRSAEQKPSAGRPPPPEQSAPPPPPQDEPDPPGPLPPATCELLPPLCS